jgi:inosine-uridine nucleoside N-ribohydrolase
MGSSNRKTSGQGTAPVKIILDTDIGCDCDDAGAMAVLHALSDLGEAEILAVTHCTSSPWGAGCIDVINNYYGRPSIPVGTLKDKGFMDEDRYCKYSRYLAENYPGNLKDGECAEDAVKLIRRVLAAQADKSVKIAAIGPLRNMRLLLESRPDEYSSMDGRELIGAKVIELAVMGGYFPGKGEEIYLGDTRLEAEYNIVCDISSARAICDEWPTPIMFSGFETGYYIMTGGRLMNECGNDNPVRKSYELFCNGARNSWDPTTVLYAVRGAGDYWNIHPYGRIKISREGISTWHQDDSCMHSFLEKKAAPEKIGGLLDELMLKKPL